MWRVLLHPGLGLSGEAVCRLDWRQPWLVLQAGLSLTLAGGMPSYRGEARLCLHWRRPWLVLQKSLTAPCMCAPAVGHNRHGHCAFFPALGYQHPCLGGPWGLGVARHGHRVPPRLTRLGPLFAVCISSVVLSTCLWSSGCRIAASKLHHAFGILATRMLSSALLLCLSNVSESSAMVAILQGPVCLSSSCPCGYACGIIDLTLPCSWSIPAHIEGVLQPV